MCVVSMVLDHYRTDKLWGDRFPWVAPNTAPAPQFVPYADPNPINTKVIIEGFKEALEAARVVDRRTGQPDCEDPEKAQLIERVNRLERMVDHLLDQLKAKGS